MTPTSLLLGDWTCGEFLDARESLRRQTVALEAAPEDAYRLLSSQELQPDLIVVATPRPGSVSREAIETVWQLAPLAPLVQLLGSWCEGETRTGVCWPGAMRVFWYDWEAAFARFINHCRCGTCPLWAVPTRCDEERLLSAATAGGLGQSDPLAIVSPDARLAEALGDGLHLQELASFWLRPGEPLPVARVAAVLWEGIHFDHHEQQQVAALRRQLPDRPLIALFDFPRLDTQRQALAAGAGAVLAKPLLIDDLFWHLGRLLARTPGRLAASARAA